MTYLNTCVYVCTYMYRHMHELVYTCILHRAPQHKQDVCVCIYMHVQMHTNIHYICITYIYT